MQHQPTCRSSERARLWGDTKVAAEKFKEASEKLAANEREKVLADEAARAAVSNRTAKTLAKKRRKRQKQREETKKRTVADDGEASVMVYNPHTVFLSSNPTPLISHSDLAEPCWCPLASEP